MQECCDDILYSRDPTKTCCGTGYSKKNLASDVCCGKQFHTKESGYQCCHGAYVKVPSGSVCCPTDRGGHVVGLGDSCCGDTPYYRSSGKVCVCSALYDPVIPRKCCGGQVISTGQICCGNRENGRAYNKESSKICCGTHHVSLNSSLCCQGSTGNFRVSGTSY